MPQSLIQLPEKAQFEIGGRIIKIRDHMIVNQVDLFGVIVSIINDLDHHKDALYQFEKHGISFEMAVEYCIQEIEGNALVFARAVAWYRFVYNIKEKGETISGNRWVSVKNFSKSPAGRIIVEQITEKMRNCDDWGELYDEMHPTSKFCRDMESKIGAGIKGQCRKV